jgi:uncharacterized UBP type Zn finger protein
VRIILEEEFAPAMNPLPGYDSKRETSMVGLENLGATCYLNALLQVRIRMQKKGDFSEFPTSVFPSVLMFILLLNCYQSVFFVADCLR